MPNLELDRLKEDPWQKQHLFLSRTDGHHESKFGLVNLDSSRTHSIAEKEQRAEIQEALVKGIHFCRRTTRRRVGVAVPLLKT
jgi:hypothetical protein